MRSILMMYLIDWFVIHPDKSAMIYHTFVWSCYLFPVVGAIICDSFWGKYKTIFWFCIIYVIGNITLSMSSLISLEQRPIGITMAMFGLLFISLGTGGIKPCVSAFGGDQFIKPQQDNYLSHYFFIFYFSINAGSLLATLFIPRVRVDISCFGYDTCYPLAFGIPAILMITAFIIFIIGKPLYTIKRPEGNMVVIVCKCMWHASRRKSALKKTVRKDHWLDYADDKYNKRLINDIKILLRILFLFLPIPFFWSLYDQQGSLWVWQATLLDGSTGPYVVTADQFQVLNPLLILLFIPLFDYILYPLFGLCNFLKKPLERIFFGGLMTAVAFVCAGLLQMEINKSLIPLNAKDDTNDTQQFLRVYNGFECPVSVDFPNYDQINISPLQMEKLSVKISDTTVLNFDVSVECSQNFKGNVTLSSKESKSIFVYETNAPDFYTFTDDITRPKEDSSIRILSNSFSQCEISGKNYEVNSKSLASIKPGEHSISCDGKDIDVKTMFIKQRGVYALIIDSNGKGELNTVTTPNEISIWWQTPQITIITAAEILVSITGLAFSYIQAPQSMKAVLVAAWLLTNSFGNVIIIFVEFFRIKNKVFQYYLFAGIMVLIMLVFWLIARSYKYVTDEELYPTHLKEEEPTK